MKSIAVASYSFSNSDPLQRALRERFPMAEIKWNREKQVLDESETEAFLRGHSHAIVGRETLAAQLIGRLPELKVVAKYGVGLDGIDLAALSAAGVRLGWTPGVNRVGVAELALTFMLILMRRLHVATRGLAEGSWARPPGRQLSGRTVGVIGCGNVGREVVRILQPFGCRILATDLRSHETDYAQFYRDHAVEPVSLDDLLKASDIVTIHTPKNETTMGLIDRDGLSRMSPDALLINTARGGIVDEDALLDALQTGRLGGAGLDVFESEPSSRTELIRHERVVATPHIGGASIESVLAMGQAAIEGLIHPRNPLELSRFQ